MSFDLSAFEAALKSFLEKNTLPEPLPLREAILYSVSTGGKRVRPRLVFASAEALGIDVATATSLAIAIELIHTYTLVHDDLPAMDNDDVRRGQPTVHRKFDEATAILAGDALIALGMDAVMAVDSLASLRALRVLSDAAGTRGVIAGQLLENMLENAKLTGNSLELWEKVARLKTGALFECALLLPFPFSAVATDPRRAPEVEALLRGIAGNLGLAFQIADDLEDPADLAAKDPKNILSRRSRSEAGKWALNLLSEADARASKLRSPSILKGLIADLRSKVEAGGKTAGGPA